MFFVHRSVCILHSKFDVELVKVYILFIYFNFNFQYCNNTSLDVNISLGFISENIHLIIYWIQSGTDN